MRNSSELIDDLGDLTSEEWNTKLAEEYGLPISKFSELVSSYSYRVVSEDNIHHKIKSVFGDLNDESEGESKKEININAYHRELGSVEFDDGDMFDGVIFCGFVYDESYSMYTLIKNCNYYNCTSKSSSFGCSRVIQTVYIDCDFSQSDFSDSSFTKCAFYDCNFRKAKFVSTDFYDCVFYNCDFSEVDGDASSFNSSFIHNSTFYNTSMKITKLISCSISFVNFSNSNIRDSIVYDCNLIEVDFERSNLDGINLVGTLTNNILVDPIYSEIFNPSEPEDDEEVDFYGEEDEDDD